jgi:hypothetical protein
MRHRPDRGGPSRRGPSPNCKWWKEVLLAGSFYLLYSLVRSTFGAGGQSPAPLPSATLGA